MRPMKTLRNVLLLLSVSVLSAAVLAPASSAQIAVGISVHVGPPALPVYAQPPCPGDGYLWTPGYWAYGPVGYYWVPGVWVMPPRVGVLWTPGTGVLLAASMDGIPASGARTSASTAASTTVLDMAVSALSVACGRAVSSAITLR